MLANKDAFNSTCINNKLCCERRDREVLPFFMYHESRR